VRSRRAPRTTLETDQIRHARWQATQTWRMEGTRATGGGGPPSGKFKVQSEEV